MQRVFALAPKYYATLKKVDFSEMGDSIHFDDSSSTLYTSDFNLLQTILSEEIACKGMTDDQMDVNDYGIELEALYDELYYLAKHS